MNIIGLYNYWIVVVLMMIGFYIVIALVVRIQEAYGSIEESDIQAQDTLDQLESSLEAYGVEEAENLNDQDLDE